MIKHLLSIYIVLSAAIAYGGECESHLSSLNGETSSKKELVELYRDLMDNVGKKNISSSQLEAMIRSGNPFFLPERSTSEQVELQSALKLIAELNNGKGINDFIQVLRTLSNSNTELVQTSKATQTDRAGLRLFEKLKLANQVEFGPSFFSPDGRWLIQPLGKSSDFGFRGEVFGVHDLRGNKHIISRFIVSDIAYPSNVPHSVKAAFGLIPGTREFFVFTQKGGFLIYSFNEGRISPTASRWAFPLSPHNEFQESAISSNHSWAFLRPSRTEDTQNRTGVLVELKTERQRTLNLFDDLKNGIWAVSDDGQLLAFQGSYQSNTASTWVWDLKTEEPFIIDQAGAQRSDYLAFSPDGDLLFGIENHDDHRISLEYWNLKTRQHLNVSPPSDELWLNGRTIHWPVVASYRGDTLVITSYHATRGPAQGIQVYSVKGGFWKTFSFNKKVKDSMPVSIHLLPGKHKILQPYSDGTVRTWDLENPW